MRFSTSFAPSKEAKDGSKVAPAVELCKKVAESSGISPINRSQFQLSLCFFASSKTLASLRIVYVY